VIQNKQVESSSPTTLSFLGDHNLKYKEFRQQLTLSNIKTNNNSCITESTKFKDECPHA